MLAFLDRVANGGGVLERAYALGLDLPGGWLVIFRLGAK
jgi:hypothetical protein